MASNVFFINLFILFRNILFIKYSNFFFVNFSKKIELNSTDHSYDTTTNDYENLIEQNSNLNERFLTTAKIEGVRRRIAVRSSPQASPLISPQSVQSQSAHSEQKLNPTPFLSLSAVGYSTLSTDSNADSTQTTPDSLSHNIQNAATATISTPNNHPASKFVAQQQANLILSEDTKFQPTIDFVRAFLDNVVQQTSPFGDKEQNKLTYEVEIEISFKSFLNKFHPF